MVDPDGDPIGLEAAVEEAAFFWAVVEEAPFFWAEG